jgi:hypothetical protein
MTSKQMKTALRMALCVLCLLGATAGRGQVGNPQTFATANLTASAASCSVANNTAVLRVHLPNNADGASFTTSGTYSGTVQFQASADNQTTWPTNEGSATSPGITSIAVNGLTDLCIYVSAYTSGTIVATINVTLNTGLQGPAGPAGAGGAAANSPLPAATSGPGPVFNVKNYGAVGNSQSSLNATATGGTGFTCTDCAFTQADVGKRISCAANFTTVVAPATTIASVTNATTIVLSVSAVGAGTCVAVWGTPDDAAVAAALAAAIAQMTNVFNSGNLGITSSAPTLYFPAGNYNLSSTAINVAPSSSRSGFAIRGDGIDQSKIYFNTGETAAQLIQFNGNAREILMEDITLDGAQGNQTTANLVLIMGGGPAWIRNVTIQRFGVSQALYLAGQDYGNKITVVANSGTGIVCQGCTGELYETVSSNNNGSGGNLLISGVNGGGTGEGFSWLKGLVDECVGGPCTQVVNSRDVWLGGGFFSGSGGAAISVDANSYVHLVSGIAGVFAQDSNLNGLTVATGGVVQASDFRFFGTGTGKCITNNGIFNDNGGNSCENMFQIASGTSTGTTAVLTLTNNTAAVNANCSVGDALLVSGTTAGYNGYYPAGATSGITAVTATTLTYTTIASNIGAIGAGGFAFCRNMQTYTGTLPKALLNNPIPNTCYVTITPIVNATTYNICNFAAQNPTNITRITASSQVTTACTVAPIITISNGTVSETLTLTTAKSSWDSSVDTSTGVGTTIFKPNTTITVKYDAGAASACTTPPTNFAVSYNISPILSN